METIKHTRIYSWGRTDGSSNASTNLIIENTTRAERARLYRTVRLNDGSYDSECNSDPRGFYPSNNPQFVKTNITHAIEHLAVHIVTHQEEAHFCEAKRNGEDLGKVIRWMYSNLGGYTDIDSRNHIVIFSSVAGTEGDLRDALRKAVYQGNEILDKKPQCRIKR